jgi:type II secretory pathway pseudopilin PulG
MTLLEALVALVILGLAAVGYVDVFQGGAQSVHSADEWAQVVSVAESTMDETLLGAALPSGAASADSTGFTRHVAIRPWRGNISEVIVTVTSSTGVAFEVHRLVRAQ